MYRQISGRAAQNELPAPPDLNNVDGNVQLCLMENMKGNDTRTLGLKYSQDEYLKCQYQGNAFCYEPWIHS